jgi:hypothetical protein
VFGKSFEMPADEDAHEVVKNRLLSLSSPDEGVAFGAILCLQDKRYLENENEALIIQPFVSSSSLFLFRLLLFFYFTPSTKVRNCHIYMTPLSSQDPKRLEVWETNEATEEVTHK